MASNRAFDAASDVADRAGKVADRAGTKARKVVRAAIHTYDEGRHQLPGLARTAQKMFSDGVDQVRTQGRDAVDVAGDQLDGARHYVIEHVQDRPLAATLAALGAGFVLGLLFASNRR